MLKVLTLKLGAYALTCKLLDSMLTEIFFFVVSNVLCPMSKGYQTISMPNFITYNKSNEQTNIPTPIFIIRADEAIEIN